MKAFLLQFFTWWTGQTLGTRFWTWRAGAFVGEDEYGNRYYRQKNGDRRWVIYNGDAEASRIPPSWHGWMHHRTDIPPTEDKYRAREWERPHLPNLTGTPAAYRPRGSILTPEKRPEVTGDYEPWTPA
jgi:NADH:ubiquinone oxidoreductase subunit